MRIHNKIIYTFFLLFFTQITVRAQQVKKFSYNKELTALSKQIFYAESSPERINANIQFIKTLVKELKSPYSFQNTLDSLQTISILTDPENKFRIFSWNLPYEDGSYRFYGAIQWNTPDGRLNLKAFTDYSVFINDKDTVTNADKWYGAQYYSMIPFQQAEKKYYILLGWNGHNIETNQKVIEVLSFNGEQAIFGAPILPAEDQKIHNRIVFEYNKQASMFLKFDKKTNRIVFDHLAPPNDKMKEMKHTYGPDLTFDALKFESGKINYQSDIAVTNEATNRDDEYIFPEHPGKAYMKKK